MTAERYVPPMVTVIMPVRNERRAISQSLGSVLAQDYPRERLEVLVADGMSDDGTRAVVEEVARRDGRVRLVDNPARVMPAGFNAALALARGGVIVMLGGHTEVTSNYVSNCVQCLQRMTADCVGGPIETVCETRRKNAISIAMSASFGVGGVACRIGTNKERYVDTVAFGAYTREVIERLGPMDEDVGLSHDDEYNYRLRKLGAKILLVPSIRSFYYNRNSLRALWKQYFRYGYWKVRVLQKHPFQMCARHFVPPLFVSILIISLMMAPFSVIGRWVCGLTAGSYMLANLAASVLAARNNNWRLLPLLPLTFATLHLSYGLGFLTGMVRFWKKWGGGEGRASHDVS